MRLASGPRVSQRQPKSCTECTRRKVRCDKRDPCAGCVRRSTRCMREIVRTSKADTVHREELNFLRGLAESLKASQDVNAILPDLHRRIENLEHGPLTITESLASAVDASQCTVTSESSDAGPTTQPRSVSSLSNERPTTGEAVPTSPDDCKDGQGPASKIHTMEFLAWGRHTGKCFPHRSCKCRSVRPYAEIVSINADPSWIGIQRVHHQLPQATRLPTNQAKALIQFHFDHILWHHNVFHAPTFLMQCEEFWTAGTVHHPLWIALYLSVLAVSSWTVLNSESLQLDLPVSEATVTNCFRAMVSTLYERNFLENLSLYSIQAITLSTRVAHNLGLSDLNATLVGAAIRIAHCLGLHRIVNADEASEITTEENWYLAVETEVGRRCWLQLIIQDYFQIPFTETYLIRPSHFSTGLPRNCHDEDMIDRDDEVLTINSYTRTLSRIALLMPPFLDGLGHTRSSYSLDDAYRQAISSELEFRALIKDIPTFFLREQPTIADTSAIPAWVDVARRSLSISAADKLIMIHRPFIFRSFQAPAFSRTRQICLSAAMTVLREHEAVTKEKVPSLWTHSAFCVTAAMVVGLELLFRDVHTDEETRMLRLALKNTAVRLRARKCDAIAERGAVLIDTFIETEEQLVIKVMRRSLHGTSARLIQLELVTEMVEKNCIVAKFLAVSHQNPSAHLDPGTPTADLAQNHLKSTGENLPEIDLLHTDIWLDQFSVFWGVDS